MIIDGAYATFVFSAEAHSSVKFWGQPGLMESVHATGSRQRTRLHPPEGASWIRLIARDHAGNRSDPVRRRVVIDTRAPHAPSVTVDPGVDDTDPTLIFISGEPGARSRLTLHDSGRLVQERSARLVGGDATIEALLPPGTYTLRVWLLDEAGNQSATSQRSFTV